MIPVALHDAHSKENSQQSLYGRRWRRFSGTDMKYAVHLLHCQTQSDSYAIQSISLAVSASGKFAATACKATTPEHAGIKVYDTKTWQQYGETLPGHQLTITRIAFSPDDRYILSVSRDRTWCIYEAKEGKYAQNTELNFSKTRGLTTR